ncbi:hypothetical protein [Epilithonimonas hungarica]|uniref:Glycosyltransferase RgtA/B/C/D-like domain-containing protein n=1 Tax=Epilithonimonas hungarica TaxID=454006 RepID=A0A1G7P1M8_9FLAO|nr:hypothetical protein [Epilithonimonas hungarica]SDF80222.1 hypothetical protein SAMN05421825_2167 [Epilithonimonas hungarica]
MEKKWKLSLLFLLPILAALTFWNYNNRVYDWDMPGYIGCMYALDYPGLPDKVRELTFSSIKKEAPAGHYADINGTDPKDVTRQYFEKNTRSFTEQLPYYEIKVGYNLVIRFLYKIGFTAPMSVLFLSLISYFFSGILLFYIFKIIFPNNYLIAFFATNVMLLLPPVIEMSRIPTPDMFILVMLLIFMIALLQKWKEWTVFIILFLITFIRPDYITFTLTYLVTAWIYAFIIDKKLDLSYFLQAAVLIVLYFFIIKFYNFPGWKSLFYDTFIYRRPFVSTQAASFTLQDYLLILFEKIINFKKVTLIAVGSLGLIFYWSKDKWIRIYSLFIFINIYIKFVFFPQSATLRFFFGFIILLLIMLSFALSKKYNGLRLGKNP